MPAARDTPADSTSITTMPGLGVGGAAWTILRARKPPGWRIEICRIGWVSLPGLAGESQALAREFCGARSRRRRPSPPAGLFDTLLDVIDASEKALSRTLTRRAGTDRL